MITSRGRNLQFQTVLLWYYFFSDEKEKKKRKKRKAINGPDKRWTNNILYYKFFQNDFSE